ncbi:MAG: hypothetical protein ACOC4I_01560 [Spirochaetota bacterium]
MTDKRVFHIDRECYVIFIGATRQDVRPFIRIGNSPRVPEEVINEIRDVIITDRLTGNPVGERNTVEQNLGSDIRYLGDPDIVARFKNFVGHDDLPTEQFETTTREEKPEAEHSFVYFYRDGGMSVYVGQDKIFSLTESEKRDRHYIELTRRIKSELLKDPLRIQKSDMQGTGFLRCGSTCMFFRDGYVSATPVRPDSFLALARKGIDPDLVGMWNVSEVSEELVRLFKRTRLKRSSLSLFYPNPEDIIPLARLFEATGDGAGANIVALGPDEHVQRNGLRYSAADSGAALRITGDLFAESVQIGAGDRGDAVIFLSGNPEPAIHAPGHEPETLQLLDAVPYTVAPEAEPGERTLSTRYLSAWTPFVRANVDAATMLVVEQIDQLFARPPQGRAREQLLKSIDQRLRAIESPASGPLALFFHNAATAVALRVRRGGNDSSRAMTALLNTLSKYADSVSEDDTAAAPCRADLYWNGKALSVFFKPASPTMSVRNVEHSREVRASLDALASDDPALYERERKELLDLLNRLRRGETVTGAASASGTASATESSRDTSAPASKSDGSRTGEGRSASDSSSGTASPGVSGGTGGRTSSSGGLATGSGTASGQRDSSRTRRFVGYAALLLVLLGGLLFLSPDIRNRVFGGAEPVASGNNDTDSGSDSGNGTEGREDTGNAGETTSPTDRDRAVGDADGESAGNSPGETDDADADATDPEQTVELGENGRDLTINAPADRVLDPALDDAGLYNDITISIADLIRITNRIAVDSGFREMGDSPTQGPDPDFVLPGAVLTLPDGSDYRIVSGDYIWLIAARSIRDNIETVLNEYELLMNDVSVAALDTDESASLAAQLDDLADQALSSALASRMQQAAAIVRREDD